MDFGGLKMRCLHVAGTATKCLFVRGIILPMGGVCRDSLYLHIKPLHKPDWMPNVGTDICEVLAKHTLVNT